MVFEHLLGAYFSCSHQQSKNYCSQNAQRHKLLDSCMPTAWTQMRREPRRAPGFPTQTRAPGKKCKNLQKTFFYIFTVFEPFSEKICTFPVKNSKNSDALFF